MMVSRFGVDAWRDASAHWLESTPLELEAISEDAAAATLSHLLGAKSFHPAKGVHEFVLASGQFSLLSNQDLREALGEMSGLYAEAEEELARDFNLRNQLVPLLPTGTLLALSGQHSEADLGFAAVSSWPCRVAS
jgi:hypothetical protein